MAEKKVESNGRMRDTVRRMYLATVGAFALAEEETEKFVDKLVDKGQKAEKEGKELVRDQLEERRKEAKQQAEEIEHQVDERIETVLKRMNLPSKSDVRELNMQIAQLSKKVDELKQSGPAPEEKKAA